MEHLIYVGIAVLGLTQVVKTLGMPSKYLPLVATLIGAGVSVALAPQAYIISAILGMAEGLSVTGVVNFSKEMQKAPVQYLPSVVLDTPVVAKEVTAPAVEPQK